MIELDPKEYRLCLNSNEGWCMLDTFIADVIYLFVN